MAGQCALTKETQRGRENWGVEGDLVRVPTGDVTQEQGTAHNHCRGPGDWGGEVVAGPKEMQAVSPGGKFWNVVVVGAWPEWEARK